MAEARGREGGPGEGVPLARWRPFAPALLTAIGLALLAGWVLHPLLPHLGDRLLGDPNADAIRGMWGLDFIRHSLIPPDTPLRSDHANFPHGALVLALPWASGLAAIPLGAVFGSIAGWNLTVAALLWGAGMATAWLVRELTGRWAIGGAAGAVLMTQPMLLHAVGDGTAEHVAVWGIAAFLAASLHALRTGCRICALGAGALAAVVTLDSPYHAVYAAVLSAFVLPWALVRRDTRAPWNELARAAAAIAGLAIVAGALIAHVYSYLPTADTTGLDAAFLRSSNAADPGLWKMYAGGAMEGRIPSLVPTLIPTWVLFTLLALALIGLPRSAPWLVSGLLLVGLSCGTNTAWTEQLGASLGGVGRSLGGALMAWNGAVFELPGLDIIRFPRRLLVPGAMGLCVGAALGFARLAAWLPPRIPPMVAVAVAVVLGVTGALLGVQGTRFHRGFPSLELPDIEFAHWIGDQPGAGAVSLLPQWRPHTSDQTREDLPTFAAIEGPIKSADTLYIQVLHGRPALGYPQLKTLRTYDRDPRVVRLIRDWNDLTLPLLQGRAIAPSATSSEFEREREEGLRLLIDAGLRYLAVDLTAYNDEALEILVRQLGAHAGAHHRFDDGGGVLVIELAP